MGNALNANMLGNMGVRGAGSGMGLIGCIGIPGSDPDVFGGGGNMGTQMSGGLPNIHTQVFASSCPHYLHLFRTGCRGL